MFVDTHPGEGQPVQRRVSYRRLNEEENTQRTGGDDNLSVHQTHGGILSSKAVSIGGVNSSDSRGRGDDEGADTAVMNHPASIWHETWLAVRCVSCGYTNH